MNIIKRLGILLGIEIHAQLYMILCLFTNLTAFYLTRQLTQNAPHYDISIPLDNIIPCIPFVWSYIYLFAFPFWSICYIIYANQSKEHAKDIFLTDLIGKILCFLIYLYFPTDTTWPTVQITDYWSFLLNAIWYTDEPNTLFPSIHVMLSWISWLKIKQMHTISERSKALIFMMVILIMLCVLFTKQHLILDIPSGILVAQMGNDISNRLFYRRKTVQMERIDKKLNETIKIFT